MRVILGLLAAAATPACLITLLELADQWLKLPPHLRGAAFVAALNVWIIAFAIAFALAIALGLPAYWLALRYRLARWWASLLAGFAIGAIPFAIESWPVRNAGSYRAWNGQVDYVVNGVPTAAGWLQYERSVCMVGLLGAVSGLAAWLVWRFAPVGTGHPERAPR
jgi:hypothetical protein